MINQTISAISTAIFTEFGAEYEIYKESIEQGLQEPCFFIAPLTPTHTQFLGSRYYRTQPFCVQYFPSTDQQQAECNAVLERLWQCLEYITVGSDLARGTAMSGEVVDGVLQFFVGYDTYVYKVADDQSLMEALDLQIDADAQ